MRKLQVMAFAGALCLLGSASAAIDASITERKSVSVELPSGQTTTFSLSTRMLDQVMLVKGVDVQGRRLLLSVVSGRIEGAIDGPSDRWDVVTTDRGVQIVERKATLKAREKRDFAKPTSRARKVKIQATKLRAAAPLAGPVTIDVLMLYTPELETALGGQLALQARVAYLEQLVNDTLEASHLEHRIRVVGTAESGVPNALTPNDALTVLKFDADAAVARDAVGADMVMLLRQITADSTEAGMAYIFEDVANAADFAFGVASLGCAAVPDASYQVCGGDDVVIHELGHMLGAGHELGVDGGGDWRVYGHASVCGDPALPTPPMTIVGSHGPFVRVFSSPLVTREGFLCGDGVTADNARVIDESFPIIAAFRDTIVPHLPSVDLAVTPDSATVGENVTISWFATNATNCTASGDWSGVKATSGNETFTPSQAGTYTFEIECASTEGASASAKATLEVAATPAPAAPEVDISVSPVSALVNELATIAWTAAHAQSCTASGDWSGTKALVGEQTVSFAAAGTYTFRLTCEGEDGSASAEATLTVTAPSAPPSNSPSTPPVSSSGGGGGAFGLFEALLFLLLVAITQRQQRMCRLPIKIR